MMTKIISILIPLLVSCSVVNQKAHPSIRRECIDLLSVRIIVDIPIPIYFNKENYEEGVIYTYVFNDGVVFFHEEALMQFDIDTYPPFESVHTKKYSMYWGEEHGKLWKKYVFGNIRLYYYNVEKKAKKKYDEILKKVRIQKRYSNR